MTIRFLAFLLQPSLVLASAQGIHSTDFKNFAYPWPTSGAENGELRPGVPSGWRWLQKIPKSQIRLRDGHLTFDPSDPSRSAYFQFRTVTYGDLDGDRQDEAAVDLLYGSGGTANWHYLYVFKYREGMVVPIGMLESGSRADGGLMGVNINNRLLLLDFADPDRSEGDCCSRGIIRVRYRIENGRFVETGAHQKDSIRSVYFPFPKTGPNTVATTVNGKDVNIIYTDSQGVKRGLTSSGVNTEPSLSRDGSSVIFLRKRSSSETEIWGIQTDGSELRQLFRGPIRWNNRAYPSSSLRSPQWSTDGQAVYFVTDFSLTSGALWRLDLTSGKAAVIIPDAVVYGVLQDGRYKGYLVSNQRSLSDPSPDGSRYPVYAFFLYSPAGEKVRQVGDEQEDLEQLLSTWEAR